MATTKATRAGSDRKRVSGQKHEINYTGRKVAAKKGVSASRGKTAVKRAKQQTRTVSRRRVERRAKQLA